MNNHPQIIMAGVEDHDGRIVAELRRNNPALRRLPFKVVGWMHEAIEAHNAAVCPAPGHDAFVAAFGKCMMCDPAQVWEHVPAIGGAR